MKKKISLQSITQSAIYKKTEKSSELITGICIAILIACSFCIQYFVSIIQSYMVFAVISGLATVVLAFYAGKNFRWKSIAMVWLLGLIAVAISTLRIPFDINIYVELYTFAICMVMLTCCTTKRSAYDLAFKIIMGFAIYFALSVWFQILFPRAFQVYIDILPRRVKYLFARWELTGAGYTGFSTNPGYTAGHLMAGLLLLIPQTIRSSGKDLIKKSLIAALLLSSLFMTGKRAHLLILIVILLVVYLLLATGKQRWMRLLYLSIAGVAALAVLLLFGDKLTFIPGLGRIAETIKGLLTGADISNNRAGLYRFGWGLFSENPVFGIGWGQFRRATVGAVTMSTELDAHNIYLQILIEMGVFGFILMMIPIVFFLVWTIRHTLRYFNQQRPDEKWRVPLLFSLCYQIFFLVYGLSGNPLYDLNYIIMYFFACTLCCAYHRQQAEREGKSTMKTGIITFHFAHNQGAVLQSYALQTALKKMGQDACIIDYRPRYHAARYAARKNPFVLASNNWKKHRDKDVLHRAYHAARGFVRGMITLIKAQDQQRENNFNRFLEKHLIRSERFNSMSHLRSEPPHLDAYISGSDQLWNPELLDGKLDPAYFMDFGHKDVKRITYAISLKQGYTAEEKAEMKKLCEKIDCLSIREHSETMDEILDRPYQVCIDPTLLLNKEDYRSLEAENREEEPYIFVYGFETSEAICEAVKLVSEELGIKVINGSPDKIKLGVDAVAAENYAPDQFLSYIKNAEFVVTNSFHGTAFSIIYQKQFVTVPHSSRGKRMTELLHKLGLSERLWGEENFSWKTPVAHDTAAEKLIHLRAESLDYLKESLEQ